MSIKRLSGAGLTTPKSNKLWDQTTFQSGMFALATVTLTSSQSSVVFSGIPQNYTHLQVRAIGQTSRGTYGNDLMTMRVGNGTLDSGSNYSSHMVGGDGANTAVYAAASQTSAYLSYKLGSTTSSAFGAFIIDILDYTSTSKYKTIRTLGGVDINGTVAGYGGEVALMSSLWFQAGSGTNAKAIDTIAFYPANANFTANTQFALYGIKSA
jgi:hypothetical protein